MRVASLRPVGFVQFGTRFLLLTTYNYTYYRISATYCQLTTTNIGLCVMLK